MLQSNAKLTVVGKLLEDLSMQNQHSHPESNQKGYDHSS
jgi:hypothetical protein